MTRKGLGEPNHSSFGCCVMRVTAKIAALSGHGTHIDDFAVSAVFHRREDGLATIEGAFEMDIEHPIPFFRSDFWKADEIANSSIVYEDVDAVELSE
jgi:hypothetical protein